MKIRFNNGIELLCEQKLLLDPIKTVSGVPSLISHAHSDHVPRDVRKPRSKLLTTQGTADILARRYGANGFHILHFNKRYTLGEIDVYPYPAGHIYGSAGFLIICGGKSIFYTGDINPYGGLTVEKPAEVPDADILLIESTYGSPKYRFPDPQRVRLEIAKWAAEEVYAGRSPVIEAYLVGKSQEVIALLNRYTNMEVVVSEKIAKVSTPFKDKFNLEYTLNSEEPHVLVTHRAKSERKARVTGWALFSRRKEDFPLSAHADFDGLMNVVATSNPDKVLTIYGFSKEFANWLKKWGIDAEPLGKEWIYL